MHRVGQSSLYQSEAVVTLNTNIFTFQGCFNGTVHQFSMSRLLIIKQVVIIQNDIGQSSIIGWSELITSVSVVALMSANKSL